MEIVFLGTAGTVPTETRNHPALVIDYLNEPFLFDCGEGTQRQIRLAKINPMRINHIFITHFHADHILGLGGLIRSIDFMGRENELNIYAPPGFDRILENLISIGAYRPNRFGINVRKAGEGVILEGENYKVTCTQTDHTGVRSVAYCFSENDKRTFLKQKALSLGVPEGRLFSKLQKGNPVEIEIKDKNKILKKIISPDDVLSDPVPGRKVIYTGDTKPCENVIKIAKNCDVLIHDSTFSEEQGEVVDDMGHSTAKQAAVVAKSANAGSLYLMHISQRYTEPEKLVKEARAVFEKSYIANDFMRVKVGKHW
ncbi:ribonuclease Z [Candidatus Altiarchaeales archaeon WOR_SM1_SCG]|nr:ribonuclease Z [Candidatus Altiarchaeales archaeon WOR_SM1_SCG]